MLLTVFACMIKVFWDEMSCTLVDGYQHSMATAASSLG